MKRVTICSRNESKIKRYKSLLGDLGLDVQGLPEELASMNVEETGQTPEENAQIKLEAYAEHWKEEMGILLAVDDACETNFLPENEQPGVYVRRINGGRELSDEEVLSFWKGVFDKYEDLEKFFTWTFAIAAHNPAEGTSEAFTVKREDRVTTHFSDTIHPGYPMSSFLMYEGKEVPVSDMSKEELEAMEKEQFKEFVIRFKDFAELD